MPSAADLDASATDRAYEDEMRYWIAKKKPVHKREEVTTRTENRRGAEKRIVRELVMFVFQTIKF